MIWNSNLRLCAGVATMVLLFQIPSAEAQVAGGTISGTVTDNGSRVINNVHIVIEKVETTDGEKPDFIKKLVEYLTANKPDKDRYRYIILRVVFELRIRMDREPTLFLMGEVSAVGVSTGTHDEPTRLMEFVKSMDQEPKYEVKGYSFTLYRGALRKKAVRVDDEKITEDRPPVEVTLDDVVPPEVQLQ